MGITVLGSFPSSLHQVCIAGCCLTSLSPDQVLGSFPSSLHQVCIAGCCLTSLSPDQELEAKFGDKVEVTGEGTPETTGYLEVEIVVGAVLHSKKGGDGYVDTSEKMNKIFAGVEAALA